MWTTQKSSATKTPARSKRATTTTNQTYQLQAEDLDNSGSSGSEFEPEENDDDELPSEEYTVETEEDLEDDAAEGETGGSGEGSGATTQPKKPKSNKVCTPPRSPACLIRSCFFSHRLPQHGDPRPSNSLRFVPLSMFHSATALTSSAHQQPVWKDILLAAIGKSQAHGTPSAAFPANCDLSAFAKEVHAHLMNQIMGTPVPTVDSVSIPSHLGSVTHRQQSSTSAHGGTSNAPPAPPPPPPAHNYRSPYESDDEEDGRGTGNVAPPPASATTGTTMDQQEVAPITAGLLQDKLAAEYTIVPPMQPGGTLQLMVQDDAIRTTVRHAIADLDRYLAFENGFPDVITRARVIADLLINSARMLTLDGLHDRLNIDRDFTRTLSAIVCHNYYIP